MADSDTNNMEVPSETTKETTPLAEEKTDETTPLPIDNETDYESTVAPVDDTPTVPNSEEKHSEKQPETVNPAPAQDNAATPVSKDTDNAATKDTDNATIPVSKDTDNAATPVSKDTDNAATHASKDTNNAATPVSKDTNNAVFKDTNNAVSKDTNNAAAPVSKDTDNAAAPVSKDTDNAVSKDTDNAATKDTNNAATPVTKDTNNAATPVSKDTNNAATPVSKDTNNAATPASSGGYDDAKISKTAVKSGGSGTEGAAKVVLAAPSDESIKNKKADTQNISGAADTRGRSPSSTGEGTSTLQFRPRSRSRTSDPKLGVDLAFGTERLQDLEPLTVGQLFKKAVKRNPDGVALMFRVNHQWTELTYSEYYNMAIKAAKSFIKLGVEDYHGVCILGFNSSEWVIANMGAMFAGALPAGIYTTNSPEACHFVADSCKANVIVVENQMQLDKILEIRDRLPYLKAIVQYKGKLSENYPNVYNWEQFMELGRHLNTSIVENKIAGQQPHQCALLIYTSGTTGNPKAVMLSHDNLTWTANCLREAYGKLEFGCEHTVSYLPLSHMAAQMADIYLTLTVGGTVHFAEPDALKGTLVATLKEAQPTIFFGVPRVYEKFMEAIQEKSSHVKGLKKKVGKWAAKKGIKGNYRRQSSGSLPMGWNLADKLVFKKVKEALGFQRCKIFVVGSAPTRQEVHEFFMSYDMPLMELYGMSESSGPQTFNVDTVEGKWRTGSCGPLVPGAHLRIHHPDKNGEGEICYYGRHVFMGYLDDEEKTKETIDDDGWLHSGDIGKVDRDGFLYITGRIKEMIITSGGENIAPVPIENRIKAEVPFLSSVFVIGNKRKYLSCLVTLLTEIDPESGEPQDQLTPMAQHLIESLGSHNTTVSGIRDPKDITVYDNIQEGIKRANLHATSNAQRIQKFAILPKDFSIAGGELGPTLKVRRAKVIEKHTTMIDSMYTVTYLYAVVKKE